MSNIITAKCITPINNDNWLAVDVDDGLLNIVGYGATEQESIDDLKRLQQELADCSEDDNETNPH